ncbi:MAG TPA: nickel pincer cofactor biosynthesis protein LarB [Coleofasciculaceae cyanobacterium]
MRTLPAVHIRQQCKKIYLPECDRIKEFSVMTQPEALHSLLEAVAAGDVSPTVALEKLKHFAYEPVGDFAKIDHHRSLRTGFPEVIWGPGKTPDQIAQIMEVMRLRNPVVMATRIEPDVFTKVQEKVLDVQYYPTARICAIAPATPEPKYPGIISLISAGTADLPVAEEAAVTAQLCGFQVQRLWDVGVAGIHRLLNNRQMIAEAHVLVVVAGMEGALPSVVAGLADCPVIAVPTSVGYGANFNGLAPLLTMLNSCATGIGVVNIDNGFGAAILAGQILRTAHKLMRSPEMKSE